MRESTHKKRAASLTLLSIMLPISLLATFRMAGIIPEPAETETIRVEPASWSMSRPTSYVIIDESASNSYADITTSMAMTAHISSYSENASDFPGWGGDYLQVAVAITANVTAGFISSVSVKLPPTDTFADLTVETTIYQEWERGVKPLNLGIDEIFEGGYRSETYLRATPINKPKEIFLPMVFYWVFTDRNNRDHWTTITLEAIFLVEGTRKRVEIPISIGVLVR